jgi:hypothetical protein
MSSIRSSGRIAYSDATLLQGLLAAPLIRAGVEPLVAANVMLVLAFPLSGLAFFYAAWRLTRSPLAALVAGALGAWCPFRAQHLSHLELQWFMFAPLAIVAALETVDAPNWRRGCGVGALVALQCLASMYYGLMLATTLVPLVAVAIWRAAQRDPAHADSPPREPECSPSSRHARFLLSIPYAHARADHGERPQGEVDLGSARAGDYLKTSRRLAAYSWHSRAGNLPERELFPGAATLALAAAGVGPAVAPLAAAGCRDLRLVARPARPDVSVARRGDRPVPQHPRARAICRAARQHPDSAGIVWREAPRRWPKPACSGDAHRCRAGSGGLGFETDAGARRLLPVQSRLLRAARARIPSSRPCLADARSTTCTSRRAAGTGC